MEEENITYKIGDKVIIKPGRECSRPGVFTITSSYTEAGEHFYRLNSSLREGWSSANFLKVPLFKVGQIVQFKDITKDRWYTGTDVIANLEGKLGIISEITEDNYTADKPGQDGCCYKVLYLQKGTQGYVTSASLELVSTITSSDDIKATSEDDPGPKGDLGITTTTAEALAQAVDNVKTPQFKIGDKVIIRNDLIPGKSYDEWGGWFFLADMVQYRGKVARITDYGYGDTNYLRLDVDNGKRSWVVNSVLPYIPGSDYDLDKTIITNKQQDYENQLQREEARITRASDYPGRGICCPRCKAEITVGHLSYKKVTQ